MRQWRNQLLRFTTEEHTRTFSLSLSLSLSLRYSTTASMASISLPSPHLLPLHLSLRSSSSAITLVPFPSLPAPIASTLRSEGVVKVKSHGSPDPALLRKPLPSPPPLPPTTAAAEGREISEDGAADEVAVEGRGGRRRRGRGGEEEEEEGKWVDWEDLILQDTVPLVGFVRMILHSGKYESGDRFSPQHEKTIIERLLPFHPEYEKKIGCGIDYITIGFHPEFENSRCLFIVRKDGELVDFSYWKCIKGLIRKNYPLYADSFILRHFRRRRDC